MTAFRFHPRRPLHQWLCALVAVVLALSPILSTAAQTHEAAHVAQGQPHFHEAHDHEGDVQVARQAHDEDDEMPDAEDALHVLAHAAHSCGHAIAILGDLPRAVQSGAMESVIALPDLPRVDAPRTHPFRPPIA
jgi:hypothetical protein